MCHLRHVKHDKVHIDSWCDISQQWQEHPAVWRYASSKITNDPQASIFLILFVVTAVNIYQKQINFSHYWIIEIDCKEHEGDIKKT